MAFSAPTYLWLLLLLPPALLLGLLTERFAQRIRTTFAVPPTRRQRCRSASRVALANLALLSLTLALAGPRARLLRAGDMRQGLVLAVGLDVSKSMLAEDVAGNGTNASAPPVANRLEAASDFAGRFFEELDGESAGLFLFARNGIDVVTPTRDQGFLRYMVQNTQLADLTESGSNLEAALETGAGMLPRQSEKAAGVIVLISDGEDTENSPHDLFEKTRRFAARKIPVYTVGVGGPAEVSIPIRHPGLPGIQGFYTDSRGGYLRTRREERTLRDMATATGGAYFELGTEPPRQLAAKLLQTIASTPQDSQAAGPHRTALDLTPLMLLATLLFYLTFMLL